MLRKPNDQATTAINPENDNNNRNRDDSPFLYLDDAWVVLNMLRWEEMQKWQSSQPVTAAPVTASGKASHLQQFLRKQLSSVPFFFIPKVNREPQKPLRDIFAKSFYVGNSPEAIKIATLARNMLSAYCKDDDLHHPSVLFDAIIVGAYVYITAMEDKKYGKQAAFKNKDLYPLKLDKMVSDCGISPDYAHVDIIAVDKSMVGQIMMERLIWMIGYKCLFEKSFPFNGIINQDFASGVAKLLPASYFKKYHLDANAYAEYPEKQREVTIRMIDFRQINHSPEKNAYGDFCCPLNDLREMSVFPISVKDMILEIGCNCERTFACKAIDDSAFVAAQAAALLPLSLAPTTATPMTATAAAAASIDSSRDDQIIRPSF
jgi:hypothetical protein